MGPGDSLEIVKASRETYWGVIKDIVGSGDTVFVSLQDIAVQIGVGDTVVCHAIGHNGLTTNENFYHNYGSPPSIP
jgi:hypothetical protein